MYFCASNVNINFTKTKAYIKALKMSDGNENWLLTDAGNAHGFAERFKDLIKFNRTRGKWVFYDGQRWNVDKGEGAAQRLFRDMASVMWQTIGKQSSREGRKELFKWASYSNSTSGMQNCLTLVKKEEKIEVFETDFDNKPYLLNCLNGTVNLRRGELQGHDPREMITQLAPVNFDPNAKSESWERFLDDTTGGDNTLRRFLQKATGYSACGTSELEKMFIGWGPTAAGKSTFMEAIKATLGQYVKTTDFNLFLSRPGSPQAASPDMARLHDARLVASSEVEDGQKLTEGLFKRFTGGDVIQARFLFKESFEFVPQFTLWLMSNKCPKIKNDSDPTWRRIFRVPFAYEVSEEKRDVNLKKDMMNTKKSGDAILAWIVEGCRLWLAEGLKPPEAVQQSTKEYRESQKPLREFYAERCVFGEDQKVQAVDLRRTYEQWAEGMGIQKQYWLSTKGFAKQLYAEGLKPARNEKVELSDGRKIAARFWFGIGLKIGGQKNEE